MKPDTSLKLELDGDKLSEKYKIEPFAYTSVTNTTFSESEEVIKTSRIDNIFKYVNKIIFNIDMFERGSYSQKDVLLGNGFNLGYGKRFYLKDLIYLQNYSSKCFYHQ